MPRAKTLIKRQAQGELVRLFEPEPPRIRAECLDGGWNSQRPCPFMKCRYHLAGEVDQDTGAYVTYHRDDPAAELPETCALDVAERGEQPLEEVARLLGVNFQRVACIEEEALQRAKRKGLRVVAE